MNKENTTWIVSQKTDIRWVFFFPFCASLVLLSLYVWLNQSMWSQSAVIITFVVGALLLDVPHGVGTYFRAFAGYHAASPQASFLWSSFAVWLIAPALFIPYMVWGSLGHVRALSSGWFWVWVAFNNYHIARQHWGFTQFYGRKPNHPPHQEKQSTYIQATFLTMGTVWSSLPYFGKTVFVYGDHFRVNPHVWPSIAFGFLCLGLIALVCAAHWSQHRFGKFLKGSLLLIAGTSLLVSCGMFSYTYFNIEAVLACVEKIVCVGFWVSAVLMLKLAFLTYQRGDSLVPHVYLLSMVGFQKVIFSLGLPYVTAYACAITPHFFHYIFMVHVYNRRYYEQKPSLKNFGQWLNQRPFMWFLACVALGALFVTTRHLANNTANTLEMFHHGSMMFLGLLAWHHNLLDAVIWRKEFIAATLDVNKSMDKALTNNLTTKMAQANLTQLI